MARSISFCIALLLSFKVAASHPHPSWGVGWGANVYSDYCEIDREFRIPNKELTGKGFLENLPYKGATVRFNAVTKTRKNEGAGVILFNFLLHPSYGDTPLDKQLLSVNLGGFEGKPAVYDNSQGNSVWLNEHDSALLLEKFMRNEIVEFSLKFNSGIERKFKIYPSGGGTFYVWEAMFRKCIEVRA